MRELVPLVFGKAEKLGQRWEREIREHGNEKAGHVMNVASWASRATFDVMGSVGLSPSAHSLS